jgi:glycosyltransferase involved in cell wall biosynthesis
MGDNSISVILPMYNEKEYIMITPCKLIKIFDSLNLKYEIIIVDDGSTDSSYEICKTLEKKYLQLRILRHRQRIGLGGALRTGFSYAKNKIIFYTDMDLPFDPSLIHVFFPMMDSYDLIIGYRYPNRRDTIIRTYISRIYNFLIKKIFDLNVKDVNFAFKFIRKDALKKIHLQADSAFIDAEILIKAKKFNLKILEIPVEYFPRLYGKSKLFNITAIFELIYDMISMYPFLKDEKGI